MKLIGFKRNLETYSKFQEQQRNCECGNNMMYVWNDIAICSNCKRIYDVSEDGSP